MVNSMEGMEETEESEEEDEDLVVPVFLGIAQLKPLTATARGFVMMVSDDGWS